MKAMYFVVGLVVIFGVFLLIPRNGAEKERAMDTVPLPTQAVIKTNKGDITLELYPDVAPKTVANFSKKAASGYYNGLRFHRVEDWVVQGGDPLSADPNKENQWGTGGGSIDTELSDRSFVDGAVGVARGNDVKVSNDSQFFIVKGDAKFLDNNYTMFGRVSAGMEVVRSLAIGDQINSLEVR